MNYNPSVVLLNLSKAKIKHYKLKSYTRDF